MKKKSIFAIGLIFTIALVSACGSTAPAPAVEEETIEEEQETPAAETEAVQSGAEGAGTLVTMEEPEEPEQHEEPEELTLLTAYVTDEEYAEADHWQSCDDTALAAVMRKAEAGEDITIAVLGGSITEGTISNGTIDSTVGFKKSYADLFKEWWETRFPNTKVTFINAGIGGTDSYLGVHRVRSHVLDFDPDLVLVEYAVNDWGGVPLYKKSYENLVRNILYAENHPAVMLLFMAQTNGSTAQEQQAFIGMNYQLPMVSYASVIAKMMNDAHFGAEELSGDVVHPSVLGHAITGEILWRYLNDVYANRDDYGAYEPIDALATTETSYENATILDASNLSATELGTFTEENTSSYFPNGWITTEGDGGLEFTAEFRNLGLLYYKTPDDLSGKFDIYIDGEIVGTIDADFSGGWGNAITGTEVYTSDETATHSVRIVKAADSDKEQLKLLGLLVS